MVVIYGVGLFILAVIPSLFSLSAFKVHLGIQIIDLKAAIACLSRLTPIFLMFWRIPMS